MTVVFSGYPAGLDLLDRIGAATKEDFAELKPRWTAELLEPTKELVDTVGPMLRQRVSPTLQYAAKINGSISPIVRDLRFVQDKTFQYKDHLLLKFWDGADKKTSPGLAVRLSTEGVGFSVGGAFTPEALARWRRALVGPQGAVLVEALKAFETHSQHGVFEPELKNPAVDVPADSPVRELLRHKSFHAWFVPEGAPPAHDPGLAEWIVANLESVADAHRWIVRNLYDER
jgi:uncharacterized protein (DUF2461 family)